MHHYLLKRRRQAIQATNADKTFPAKFAYLVNCVFQNWCTLMAEEVYARDPLCSACNRNLDNYLRDEIEAGFGDF